MLWFIIQGNLTYSNSKYDQGNRLMIKHSSFHIVSFFFYSSHYSVTHAISTMNMHYVKYDSKMCDFPKA